MSDKEVRTCQERVEVRSDDAGRTQITGYAAVFNSFSEDLGGFKEIVRSGAFRNALSEGDDVRGLFNHDVGQILGRTSSGTMRLKEDKKGLRYEIDVPQTTAAKDVVESIRRGDITGSSFSFTLRDDSEDAKSDNWRSEGDQLIREVLDVRLFDVGPVTFPAYQATVTAATRSLADQMSNDLIYKAKAAAQFDKYSAPA